MQAILSSPLKDNGDTNWYAIYTRSRYEKKVAEELVEKNITCFLPLREVMSRWKDRRKLMQWPLFPGYVFIDIDLRDRLKVLQTPGVVRIVGFEKEPVLIPREQIYAVMMLVQEKIKGDPCPYLREGQRVEVIRGPLKGVMGILLKKRVNFRLVLSVDLIMKSVSLEIDAADVRAIG